MFCGSTTGLSREHVFPQWIERLFPDHERDFIRLGVTLEGDEREHTRPGRGIDFVTKEICPACNNGWMAELESAAKPIIEPLILDQPRGLDPTEQHIVATWGTKTVLTIQGVNFNEYRLASDNVYRWFFRHRTPLPDSHVWLGRYGASEASESRWPVTYHQAGFYLAKEGEVETPPAEGQPTGYTVAMAIGRLALQLWGHTLGGGPRPEGV
jgi:hypothetical protein